MRPSVRSRFILFLFVLGESAVLVGVFFLIGCNRNLDRPADAKQAPSIGPSEAIGKSGANENEPTGAEPGRSVDAGDRSPSLASPETPDSGQGAASPSKSSSGSHRVLELSFDDIKFEMDKGASFTRSLLPQKVVEEYDGATVRLRGFIRPASRQTGISRFVFVRDNKECCFGPGAALCDSVLVKLKRGKTTDYTVLPITVEGTFYLKEYDIGGGNILAIYRIKNAQVK